MIALQGQLNEGVLANLLQYLAMNAVSGCLTLRHPDGTQAYLFLENGQPVHISLGALGKGSVKTGEVQTDVAALSVLLSWKTGRFDLRENVPPPVRSIDMSLNTLLLEAAREMDETVRDKGILLHADSVLSAKSLRDAAGNIAEHVVLSIAALQLMKYLDGVNTLAEVARLSGLPLPRVMSAAEELHQQGLVFSDTVRVEPGFLRDLTGLMVELVGPMGEIIVEDTLLELGFQAHSLPTRAVAALLSELKRQLRRDTWRAAFGRASRELCERYTVALRQ